MLILTKRDRHRVIVSGPTRSREALTRTIEQMQKIRREHVIGAWTLRAFKDREGTRRHLSAAQLYRRLAREFMHARGV